MPPIFAIQASIASVYSWSVFNAPLSMQLGVFAQAADDWDVSVVLPIFSVGAVTLGFTTFFGGQVCSSSTTAALCYCAAFCCHASPVTSSLKHNSATLVTAPLPSSSTALDPARSRRWLQVRRFELALRRRHPCCVFIIHWLVIFLVYCYVLKHAWCLMLLLSFHSSFISIVAGLWGGGLALTGVGATLHSLPLMYLGFGLFGGAGWGTVIHVAAAKRS